MRQNRIKRPEVGLIALDPAPVTVPPAPPALLKGSRERWEAYWRSTVAKVADPLIDLHRVERWIRAVDEYERVGKSFRRRRLVEGSTGQPVLNPLATYLAQLRTEIGNAERDLGLTPMARLRLGIAFGQAKLTAAELNKQLEQDADRDEAATEFDEWEDA